MKPSQREIIVDLFAGGSGASTGIALALGKSPDIAINHSDAAIAMHEANHPTTKHFRSDIWDIDPRIACGRRRVRLLWMSPDCRHFSRAKGGVPVSKGIRSLAWVGLRWAASPCKPLVMILENVPEFVTWGPLGDDGRPDPTRVGETFRQFVEQLRFLGYVVEWRTLVAADFGAPTTRKRLFMIARCDGQPIVWPEPTHGKGRALPWRTAAEIIDWSIPCPSIFGRKRPLAEATLRRIAAGVWRYVINSARPFIVPVKSWGWDASNVARSLNEPMRTITTSKGGEYAIVSPTLVQTDYGEREGQAPRALDLQQPLGTVVAGGAKAALVSALLTKHYGGVVGHGVEQPIGTVTSQDHHSLTVAHLSKFYGTATGASLAEPLPTVTATGQHLAEVRAFLVKYYGTAKGAALHDPLDTVTTRDRFGLVTIGGQDYAIADIGMRMLQPRELFNAQGFPPDFDILDGRLTKTQQIALAGNSVCPPVAEQIVRAQFGRTARLSEAA